MDFPHPIRSLAQVPEFSPLLDICREFDVEITAFGSVVRRLATALIRQPTKPLPDLFELSRFLSDIDLYHSGRPEQTVDIRQAILGRVAFSECFRWEIFSKEERKPFTDDEVCQPVIPVNKLTLSTRGRKGIQDPFNGYDDIVTRRYRLLRTPHYHRSRLWQQYRDCEFLYVLEYLKVLFEEASAESEPVAWIDSQPGWKVAKEITHDVGLTLGRALDESAYLRARFHYQWQALRGICRSRDLWKQLVGPDGIGNGLDYIDEHTTEPVRDPEGDDWAEGTIATSCRLAGNDFRLKPEPYAPAHDDARGEWSKIPHTRDGLRELTKYPFPKLPEKQSIVADTPEYHVNLGKAPSALGNEHLHFQMKLSPECAGTSKQFGETRLAAFLMLSVRNSGAQPPLRSLVFPIPAVCWLVDTVAPAEDQQTRLQVRANSGRLLEVFPDFLWQIVPRHTDEFLLKLFIVGQS